MADKLDSTVDEDAVDEAEEVEEETPDESEVDETADEPTEEEETSDEDESEEESEPAFDKRFTQFKGDTPEEYAKNLEDAYANSTSEFTKLKTTLGKELAEYKQKLDQIGTAVANDPEVAEKLNSSTTSVDPALQYAREQMESQMQREYDDFAKIHPEIETDPETGDRLTKRLATLSKIRQEEGGTLSMKEGLEVAYASLGLGNNSQQENVAMAAKNVAASSKTTSSKKPVPKSEFTPSQLAFAQKAGLTEKDLRAYTK